MSRGQAPSDDELVVVAAAAFSPDLADLELSDPEEEDDETEVLLSVA